MEKKVASGAKPGTVYLVGAGPGDAELLTLRAARLIAAADVLVYDYLVAPAILDLARAGAERIFAGKRRGDHAMPQHELNLLLVKLAQQGKCVVRLKGGDPYIFGRGGEEVETLVEHGIPFEVTPGITAASGVAAYAGIPLTHRDYAHACVFVTGHLKTEPRGSAEDSVALDWAGLARKKQTVVIYMGLVGLPTLCAKLVEHGLPSDWPAAIVQQGTTPNQRTVVGTLATLPQLAVEAQLQAPTLIIVGEVVKLHDRLAWYPEAPTPHPDPLRGSLLHGSPVSAARSGAARNPASTPASGEREKNPAQVRKRVPSPTSGRGTG